MLRDTENHMVAMLDESLCLRLSGLECYDFSQNPRRELEKNLVLFEIDTKSFTKRQQKLMIIGSSFDLVFILHFI